MDIEFKPTVDRYGCGGNLGENLFTKNIVLGYEDHFLNEHCLMSNNAFNGFCADMTLLMMTEYVH